MIDMYTPEQWRGVAAPTQNETSLLLFEMTQFDNEGLFYRLAQQAYQTQPQLEEIIDYALGFYENTDFDEELFTKEEFNQYMGGLSEGCDFMLGCMTFIEISRSPTPVQEAIEDMSKFLPDFATTTKNRFKKVISGDAPVDVSWTSFNPDFNSSQLPKADMGELLYDYPFIDDLFYEATRGYDHCYADGFMAGAELILALYVQNAEEKMGILLEN